MIHPTLGAVGAILLFANYVVTAAISTYEAVIYIGGPFDLARGLAPYLTAIAIIALGVLNYVGPKRAGTFALVVALAAVGITALLATFTVPHFGEGWTGISGETRGVGTSWMTFVAVVLALSGVESIANMTGIMVRPVGKTAKKSIYPVLAEVIILNLVLVVIVCSVPQVREAGILADKPAAELTEQDHAIAERILDVVARQYLGSGFAALASIIFGLLLLSATNTAIVGMISIQFAMSRDRELPDSFSRLNQYGVPAWGLVVACVLPAIVTFIAAGVGAGTVQTLARLYAIGVVGAIAINLSSCAYNRKLDIRLRERVAMWALAAVMLAIWISIALTNLPAALFLLVMLSGGMILRAVARAAPERVPALAAVEAAAVPEAEPGALPAFDPGKGKILVATRGNLKLLKFAFDEAQRRESNLFVLYIRDIAVMFQTQERLLRPDEDAEASELFRNTERMAREFDVPIQTIYCVSPHPADVILDFAATYAADLVILGVSRRAGLLRALRGDVISGVADHLPDESTLLIHA